MMDDANHEESIDAESITSAEQFDGIEQPGAVGLTPTGEVPDAIATIDAHAAALAEALAPRCGACGQQMHPFTGDWWECPRCESLQRSDADPLGYWREHVDAADHGAKIEMPGPFRAGRPHTKMLTIAIEGDYMLEWNGAVLLMAELGCELLERRTNQLIFRKV